MAYSVIKKPSDYFTPNLHSGTGSSQNITTGLNMSANGGLVWNKVRSTSNNHILCDTIRGATKLLHSDLTLSEQTDATSLTSFNTDGWTGGGGGNTNGSGQTFVSWNWLAGSSPSGVANTDGTISSTVSANTTSGFSIVSYTGTGATGTIGHGLNSAPSCIITKSASAAEDWGMYHVGIGNTSNISLNLTNAQYSANSAFWNNTNPTSSVFTVGTHPTINYNTQTMIAYCFAEKQGFSKFGSYVGNGSTDGTFVYTGFKPSFILVKSSSAGSTGWNILDNKRDPENVMDTILQPNNSNADANDSNKYCDFLSNGFKWRASGGETNGSGTTYIYMAFAENPLVGDNPATAR